MIANRIKGLHVLHLSAQCALSMMLFWAWVGMIFDVFHYHPSADLARNHYLIFSVLAAVGLVINSARTTHAPIDLLAITPGSAHAISLRQTFTAVGTIFVFVVATKNMVISRVFIFSFVPVFYLMLFISNCLLPRIISALVFNGVRVHRTLLLGKSAPAARLKPWLKRKSRYGIRPVGLISDEQPETPLEGVPWLGSLDNIENIIRTTRTTQVILVELIPDLVERVAEVCARLGVRFLVRNDLDVKLRHPIQLIEDDGLSFIGIHREPLESPLNRLLKRLLDIAISLPVVVLILPLVSMVVFILHRLQSPGPLLYVQRRVGLQNEAFLLWKYRTMHVNHGEEARQATIGDVRVFPAGRWLRKFSIDELPQFINVLCGEMSVIGPRPHLVAHNVEFARIKAQYHVRSFIKPGLSGLAQVRGFRGRIDTEQDLVNRIESDLYYLENWSLWLDWKLVFQTAWKVLFPPPTAY